ncbi:YybH family protein [Spirosoma utsteinense]|uniref:Ketosteroid isomerase-like protein n=1 Tax=Spirosoma utsteinense TaxID=2585773 RepID=A0ABR6WA39_9BACT|nr:nuclear transport factor 2 family protein [Spirosoma utsteinense]MBC3788710.1 ketosteroid isomerase-like protein [Spirosoma utsteinense]MBC3792730.1 ketosteroid isomerase-like protein [Spirosoma utsteinense]
MKSYRCLLLLCLLSFPAFSQPVAADRRAILSILKRQTDDWNNGRIDKFMTAYWPSDSLTFVGKAGITYGYEPTLSNYRKRYPDRASMGSLRFDILQLDFPAPNVAYVIGRWSLTRPKIGNADGHFTLLWRKSKKRWVIVSDHSSSSK